MQRLISCQNKQANCISFWWKGLFHWNHGVLFKYNQKHDLRDSIFGSSRQMTITLPKNAKKSKENGWQTLSFQQVFFFSKSVLKYPGCKTARNADGAAGAKR